MNYYWGFANDFSDEFDDSDVLEHHGILGMKWGIRRYQPYGVGYNAKNKGKFIGSRERRLERTNDKISKTIEKAKEAKSSGDISKLNKLNAKTKRLTEKSENLEKKVQMARIKQAIKEVEENEKRKAAEEKRIIAEEEAKKKILTKADVNELLENSDKMSTQELRDAIERARQLNTLDEMSYEKQHQKFDRGVKFAKKIIDAGKTGIDAYKTYTSIQETFKDKTSEKEKAEIIKSADMFKIFENRDKLSKDELNSALQRLTLEEDMDKKYKLLKAGDFDAAAKIRWKKS